MVIELRPGIDALMFDLDGTLVDTMSLHYAAYAEVLSRKGLTLDKADYFSLVGPPASVAIPGFIKAAGGDPATEDWSSIHTEKKAAFGRLLRSDTLVVLPAATILKMFARDIPCGLVSSGNRDGVMAILRAMGWIDWFNVIVTGDDVDKGKPDPQPYSLAATALKISPDHCIAFEDTLAGITSARAAGMTVVDVTKPDFEMSPLDSVTTHG